MKRNILFIFSLLIVGNNILAQSPLVKQWDKRFGGTGEDFFYSLKQTTDGGYILGGFSNSGISGDKTQNNWDTTNTSADYWIVKIDTLGIKLWDKRYGGTGYDVLVSLKQTTEGGFILGGYSYSDSSGDKTEHTRGLEDFWIVKTDSLGNKLWDKRFGGTDDDELSCLQQTTDGGYILGGWSESGIGGDKTQPSWGGNDYWIVKTDSLGNKLWDKRFGGTFPEYLYSIQQTSDKGYILGGWSNSPVSGDKTQPAWIGGIDYWIVKIDSLGIKLWDKRFGGLNSDQLASLFQTADDGYILGGVSASGIGGDKTQSNWGGGGDYWLVKIDSLGIMQWDKDLGGTNFDWLSSLQQTIEGGYILGGISRSPISGDKTQMNWDTTNVTADYWIVKTNSLGVKLWDVRFGGIDDDWLYSLQQTTDAGYICGGWSLSGINGDKTQPSWGLKDYWIIKFNDTTSTTSINQISITEFSISIYPNPVKTKLNFFLNKMKNIIITNVIGEIVLETNAKGKIELDVSFLSAGIYFIKVGNEVRKFVKE